MTYIGNASYFLSFSLNQLKTSNKKFDSEAPPIIDQYLFNLLVFTILLIQHQLYDHLSLIITLSLIFLNQQDSPQSPKLLRLSTGHIVQNL